VYQLYAIAATIAPCKSTDNTIDAQRSLARSAGPDCAISYRDAEVVAADR
jgi:hypothetical protein